MATSPLAIETFRVGSESEQKIKGNFRTNPEYFVHDHAEKIPRFSISGKTIERLRVFTVSGMGGFTFSPSEGSLSTVVKGT